LLFILSGIGSNPYFGLAPYFAGLFYGEGFHVVVLPSPMTWNFALAGSRSGAPGYAPEDARDLYEGMQKLLPMLRTQYGLEIVGINFLGASLGALEGAYLSVIDAEERKIGIQKFLLVNPPLDLSYALAKVDEWDAFQNRFGRDKSKKLVAKALGIVESFSKDKRDDPAVFERFAKAFAGFTTEEIQFLIAEDMQALLPDLAYVTQGIHDPNALRASKDQARKRLQEAKALTFSDYSEKIAVPLWRLQAAEPRTESESFWKRGSLAPILGRLRGYSPVQFMHNADDFIARRESIEELKAELGDQVMLYPYGGHLGNLWYPENKEYVLRYFRTPR
jgi:predicted alpha/beta-fold hydrolase